MARVRIDGNTMAAARNAAKKREAAEYRDTDAPGLAIVVKSGTARFSIVTKSWKRNIGPVAVFGPDDLPTLRALVPKVKKAIDEGADPKPLIDEVVGGERDIELAEHKAGVKAGEWTWEMMRDEFIAHSKDTAAHRSYTNHVSALGTNPKGPLHKDFEHLLGKPVKSITPNDLATVTRNILQRGKQKENASKVTNYSQARQTHASIQAVFAWATDPSNQGRSGLTMNIARLIRMPKKPKQEARDLNPEEVLQARLVNPKQIWTFVDPWCKQDRLTKDCSRAALMLQALTGQRIATVLRSMKAQFIRVHGRPWSYVWALGPDKMGAWRALPLPEVASWVIYHQLKRTRDDNKYLFPQLRRGKGKPDRNGHLSDSTISDVTDRGRAKGGPLPSTFKGSHDLRRAFTTHLGDWSKFGFAGKDSVEKITHRNEGAESVSQAVYNLSPELREKFKVLQAYQTLLLKSYDPKWDGSLRIYEDLEDEVEFHETYREESEEWFSELREAAAANFDPKDDRDPDD